MSYLTLRSSSSSELSRAALLLVGTLSCGCKSDSTTPSGAEQASAESPSPEPTRQEHSDSSGGAATGGTRALGGASPMGGAENCLSADCEPLVCTEKTWDHDLDTDSPCQAWSTCGENEIRSANGTPSIDRACLSLQWIDQFGPLAAEDATAVDPAGDVLAATWSGYNGAWDTGHELRKYNGATGLVDWSLAFPAPAGEPGDEYNWTEKGKVQPLQSGEIAISWSRYGGYYEGGEWGDTQYQISHHVALVSAAGKLQWEMEHKCDSQLLSDGVSTLMLRCSGEVRSLSLANGSVTESLDVGVLYGWAALTTEGDVLLKAAGGISKVSGKTGERLFFSPSEHTSLPHLDEHDRLIALRGGHVIALDASDGSELWDCADAQDGHSHPEVASLSTTPSGDVLIGGSTDLIWGQPTATANDSTDAIVQLLSGADGTELWTKQLGSWREDSASHAFASPNGAIYASGQTKGNLDGKSPGGHPPNTFIIQLTPASE